MLLDRIDIDAHGPLHHIELGPFAEHLNVVCGPEGSGKTAIARFVRDSLVNRTYPLGMLSSSTGRIVWADGNGLVHCRREKDGTTQGRRTVEFESRGDLDRHYNSLANSWLSGVCSSTDSSRAIRSIQLPESIVDGVITDTAVTSVARVVSACVRSGLDSHETYRSLPLGDDSIYHDRDGYAEADGYGHELSGRNRHLREELSDVEAELSRFGDPAADHEALVARRNSLAARLARRSNVGAFASARRETDRSASNAHVRSHHAAWQQKLTELHDRARQLRARQSELRRWIAEIDRDIARSETRYPHSERDDYQYRAAVSDEDLRRQLDDLDAQMIRWRRTLLEVRGLRQTLLSSHGNFRGHSLSPLDETALRRMRLDGFLHAIDRYDRSNLGARSQSDAANFAAGPAGDVDRSRSWDDLYPDSYRPLHHMDDIDHRIDSATRQIDWLLDRYTGPDKPQFAWYETLPNSGHYRSASTLGDALRAIREDLRQVQRYTSRGPDSLSYGAIGELEELRLSEQWLVASIDRLNRHREALLRDHAATGVEAANWTRDSHHDRYVLSRERRSSIAQLDRVTSELDTCLAEAADVRRSSRTQPVVESRVYDNSDQHDWIDRDALVAELRRIDDRLASSSRLQWLKRRRSQLLEQLRVVRRPVEPWCKTSRRSVGTKSPLADAASRWLIRLSAGRLQRLDWPLNQFRADATSYHRDSHLRTGVTINGRDESECPAADRALAVMAVRLAAGDLLARTGRHIPLVVETPRDLIGNFHAAYPTDVAPLAYYEHGDHFRSNHPIATALRDYSQTGRQVIVLTSDQDLTAQLSRAGARSFQIHAERVVHAHRPLWRPHYDSEQYVGPHPHTYGSRGADEVYGHDVDRASANCLPRERRQGAPIIMDVNRDFDMAWREAYGFYDNPDRMARTSQPTDRARDGVDYRDGYYFADTFTTTPPQQSFQHDTQGQWVKQGEGHGNVDPWAAAPVGARPTRTETRTPASPFFLSVDSPIDQAPSIDAVAAARLRGLNVTHINHLMQQDSNRLADALGLANVDATTIRRWQAECRLVCRVPQLRGFDARVLVGCGVTTPAQLASIHPVDLLQEVEVFLATQRGQQILLSGSSHELSRITSWIATGNSSSERDFVTFGRNRNGERDPRNRQRSYYRGFNNHHDNEYAFDSDRYEYEDEPHGNGTGRRRRRIIRTMNERDAASSSGGTAREEIDDYLDGDNGSRARRGRSGNRNGSRTSNGSNNGNGTGHRTVRSSRSGNGNRNGRGNGIGNRSGNGNASGRSEGVGRSRRRRSRTTSSGTPDRSVVRYERERAEREPRVSREPREPRQNREPREYREREAREPREQRDHESELELRFYLHRESPVVDAPSIGSRMGERLNTLGIYTVDELLNADPETTASELDHRRVDADTILQWQQQATLVCRVPMLRGHDAQLLVAAEVTTPEELAASEAEELLGIVDPIARSSEGKRIIRGGKMPDLEEVTDWIRFAQHQRELMAA